MITKRIVIGLIQILENGVIQVRADTVLDEDGVEISRQYHRHVVDVGDNVDNESDWVKKISAAIWTDEIIKARKEELERIRKATPGLDPNTLPPIEPIEPETK